MNLDAPTQEPGACVNTLKMQQFETKGPDFERIKDPLAFNDAI